MTDGVPVTETRGGEAPDWDRVRPGQVTPEKAPGPEGWCGNPRCGGD